MAESAAPDSVENALEVNHISEEYAYLLKNGLFGDFCGQQLMESEGAWFDVLTFVDKDGIRKDLYFKLSKEAFDVR